MPKKRAPEDFSFRPFRDLKNKIVSEKPLSPAPRISTNNSACADDEDLFLSEMKDVREIKEYRQIPVRRGNPVPKIRKALDTEKEALKTLEDISRGKRPIKLDDTQEYVEWVNSSEGCTQAVARKLHEGHFAVQDFLDLHGFTLDEAKNMIEDFLKASRLKDLRCVKIIHGRGLKSQQGPVLKEALIKLLISRYRKNVIAFATARRHDGGLGALYILLKQNRCRN
jgi:DNA-nicking Smr family endonuclease